LARRPRDRSVAGAPANAGRCAFAALSLLAACPDRLLAPADPESALRAQLDRTTSLHRSLAGGEDLDLEKLRFSEVIVSLHGDVADVLLHAEAAGRLAGAPLHYVGSERLALRRTGSGFSPLSLPALEGVLDALEARQRALEARDAAALLALAAEDYREGSVDRARLATLLAAPAMLDPAAPSSLAVRVDGDRATVSLSFASDGGRGTHILALENVAKSWRFSAGLL
jgi:hypothetical protein